MFGGELDEGEGRALMALAARERRFLAQDVDDGFLTNVRGLVGEGVLNHWGSPFPWVVFRQCVPFLSGGRGS